MLLAPSEIAPTRATEHDVTTATTESIATPGLPSVRGLVIGQNQRGQSLDPTALRQWLRLSAEQLLVLKVDLWEPEARLERIVPLLEEARLLKLRLSLRTTARTDPDTLHPLIAAGLLDILLCIDAEEIDHLTRWAEVCASLGVALRVQLNARELGSALSPGVLQALSTAKVLTFVLNDPLTPNGSGPNRPLDAQGLVGLFDMVKDLTARGPEVHVMDVPFCQVPAELWPCISNRPQQMAHHQHYQNDALEVALKLFPLAPDRIRQYLEIELGRGASFHRGVDHAVLPWILRNPRGHFWLWFFHKLTRRMFRRRARVQTLPQDTTALENRLARYRDDRNRALGEACARCRLHPICNHFSEDVRHLMPKSVPTPVTGEPVYDPLTFRAHGTVWHDAVDVDRLSLFAGREHLVRDARRQIADHTTAREIAAEAYAIEGHFTDRMPASVRWFSFSTAELQSTVLARLSPPFTLALTVGGGIADAVGFSVGRTARILCPMTAYDHQIVLHVDAHGHYVLLRDGVAVPPAALHDAYRVPERLGSVVEPRIALINVDGQIVTQTVLLWESETRTAAATGRHSVVIVCSRFSRRLQAALQLLAHQQGLQPGELEVIVAYVPGIDATDDVLDSIQAVYPALTLRRIPFAPDRLRAKGFLINECTALASGDWVTLLDADILLPPDYFVRLDALDADTVIVAPEGRHMLDATATARILLGEIRPWDHYNELRQQAAEYRHHESDGVPPGFCQSVRRRVFDSVHYEELDHFEGSDWWFSRRVMDQFGPVRRLDGMAVLHLDHGGSQWYGTGKQR